MDNGSDTFSRLCIQHLVAMPGFDCLFCSAQEKDSGKTNLFLIFDRRNQVYRRNALKETWVEVKDERTSQSIREGCNLAIKEQKVPCYRT